MTKDDHGSALASSERRTEERYLACFPAHLALAPDSNRMALIQDISIRGALLFTQNAVDPDERVALKLYVDGDPEKPRVVHARVVRFEKRNLHRADFWPYTIAVQFEEPIHDLTAEVEALAARQAQLRIGPTR